MSLQPVGWAQPLSQNTSARRKAQGARRKAQGARRETQVVDICKRSRRRNRIGAESGNPGIRAMARLQVLKLYRNRISDDCVEHFADLPRPQLPTFEGTRVAFLPFPCSSLPPFLPLVSLLSFSCLRILEGTALFHFAAFFSAFLFVCLANLFLLFGIRACFFFLLSSCLFLCSFLFSSFFFLFFESFFLSCLLSLLLPFFLSLLNYFFHYFVLSCFLPCCCSCYDSYFLSALLSFCLTFILPYFLSALLSSFFISFSFPFFISYLFICFSPSVYSLSSFVSSFFLIILPMFPFFLPFYLALSSFFFLLFFLPSSFASFPFLSFLFFSFLLTSFLRSFLPSFLPSFRFLLFRPSFLFQLVLPSSLPSVLFFFLSLHFVPFLPVLFFLFVSCLLSILFMFFF